MEQSQKHKVIGQAVVIVNSFSHLLYPLSMEVPLGLLPMANMRMIDYVMYWLTAQKIEEIIVCYVSHDEEIHNYFDEINNYDARLSENLHCSYVTPVIKLHYMPSCNSTGDILRELDDTGVLTEDHFLLVGAGVISNLDLGPAWKEHINRWKQSSSNCMTSVFTHIPYIKTDRSRDIALMLDKDNRILAYDDLKEKTRFTLLNASVLETANVSIRFDVAPAGIHICSREVAMHFTDNYDYNDLCEDYLRKEVTNVDFGYKYYAYFDDASFSQQVVDIRTYRDVASNLVRRWFYPTAPDNVIARDRAVPYARGDIYLHPTAVLDYTTSIGRCTLVEKDCVLKENAKVVETLLGMGCQVGVGVVLQGCVIGEKVVIGDGCKLTGCVVMGNVVIGEGTILEKCTVGEGVKIAAGVHYNDIRIHK